MFYSRRNATIGSVSSGRLERMQLDRSAGLSFENLGMGIAAAGLSGSAGADHESLPTEIRKCASNATSCGRLRFSNEFVRDHSQTPDADRDKALPTDDALRRQLPVTEKQLAGLMERSMQDIAPVSLAVNVN